MIYTDDVVKTTNSKIYIYNGLIEQEASKSLLILICVVDKRFMLYCRSNTNVAVLILSDFLLSFYIDIFLSNMWTEVSHLRPVRCYIWGLKSLIWVQWCVLNADWGPSFESSGVFYMRTEVPNWNPVLCYICGLRPPFEYADWGPSFIWAQ